MRRHRRSPLLPWLLVLPTAVGVAAFTLYPLVRTIHDSLYKQNQAVRIPRFVGLGNYANLFDDEVFRHVLVNTLVFVVGTVPLSVLCALLFALYVNRKMRGISVLRSAFFYPTVLPLVSAATIWLFLYTPNFGLFNQWLHAFGVRTPPNWLGDTSFVLPALIVMAIWKQTGYFMLFYLAGLQNLSGEVFEAASLDGASPIQVFRFITVPLLSPTTLFVSTIAVVSSMQMVEQLYVMTQGGPSNASNMLLFHLYETAFRFRNLGEANAMTVILVAVLLVFTVANFVVSERRAA